MTEPTVSPSPSPSASPSGPYTPVPHTHPFTSVTGLRYAPNGRVEPAYDSGDVKVNGKVIALYNAAVPKATFSANTVPPVTVQDAVQDNDGDSTDGAAQATQFLAEGKITQQEYNVITQEIKPTGTGVAPSTTVKGNTISVSGDAFTYDTVLTLMELH